MTHKLGTDWHLLNRYGVVATISKEWLVEEGYTFEPLYYYHPAR